MVSRILFNDPVLIGENLCIRAAGHDNHLHVEIEPLPATVGYAAEHDDLQFSLGLGNQTTHVCILSPGRERYWLYASYEP